MPDSRPLKLIDRFRSVLGYLGLPDSADLDIFTETVRISDLGIQVCGFAARVLDAGEFIGAAGGFHPDVQERAFSELIERIVTWKVEREARADPHLRLPLHSFEGSSVEMVPAGVLFPPRGDRWVFSRTNGAASHPDLISAIRGARRELIERDRLLRSWYGEFKPTPMSPPSGALWTTLSKLYELHPLSLGEGATALVGFAFDPAHPLLLGFGCHPDEAISLQVSLREAVQRLAFLWGEEIPTVAPTPEPTPLFHLNHGLFQGTHQHLREWIKGDRAFASRRADPATELSLASDRSGYVVLTPGRLPTGHHVVKAFEPDRMPVVFGEGHPWLSSAENLCPWRTHPIP